ncbi:hypothetical protein RB201_11190 [Streptomyces sp. S1A(2023)]
MTSSTSTSRSRPRPDHPEAVELSRTARPEGSDHLNWRLNSTDAAASPDEAAERRTRDDAAVLQYLLGYAGVPDRGPAAEALLRRLVRQGDADALTPGPAVPRHFLEAVESVVTSAAVVDHPLTARGTRPASGIDDPAQALRTPAPGAAEPEPPVAAAVPFRTTSSAPTETGTSGETTGPAWSHGVRARPVHLHGRGRERPAGRGAGRRGGLAPRPPSHHRRPA